MRTQSATALAALLFLAACQSISGGRPTTYSEAKTVELAEADLNLPRFLHRPGLDINRRVRDNGSIVVEVYKRRGTTVARTERVYAGWFSERTEQDLKDSGYLARLLKGNAARYGADRPIPAPSGGRPRTLGYYSENGACAAFIVGFRNRIGSEFDNDRGGVDTVAFFAGCGDLSADVEAAVAGLRGMTDQDRIAISARAAGSGLDLAALVAAARPWRR